jgi:dinuclear metal center YbgI/SA1388 family protein
VNIKEVVTTLESFAPLPLQESYDNAGLQIGLTATEVSGVLLCLDVTEKVILEAETMGCNLIVSHHPLLFKGLKCISDASLPERCVALALKKNIAIYSVHTNLDNADGGVNFEIARRLGLRCVRFMIPNAQEGGSGLIGELPEMMEPMDFLQMIRREFHVECLMHNELLNRPVQRVSLCGGAGAFLLEEAVRQKADAFLTGEMHYHMYMGLEQRIQIAVLGHYQSEQYTKELLSGILSEAYPDMKIVISKTNTNPICYLYK